MNHSSCKREMCKREMCICKFFKSGEGDLKKKEIYEQETMNVLKIQRVTNNLGKTTIKYQENYYKEIEKIKTLSKCSSQHHIGDTMLPVRLFYLNKGGMDVQGACIVCQKLCRKLRIIKCKEKFETIDPIVNYKLEYGNTKLCSSCKIEQIPENFGLSKTMECGLHNHCLTCSIGNSQGNGGLRDFIFMPDKDSIKYKKKTFCEQCNGTNKLAVDHIVPIAKGGTDCIVNKQTLCVHCNSKKSDTIVSLKLEQICERYRDQELDCNNILEVSRLLCKKVHDFKYNNFQIADMDTIRQNIDDYRKRFNLNNNLDRLCNKIKHLFKKV